MLYIVNFFNKTSYKKSSYNKFYDISINGIFLDIPDASPSTNKTKLFNEDSVFEMWPMVSLLLCRVAEVCCKKDERVLVS